MKVLFCPVYHHLLKTIAFLKVPNLRPVVLHTRAVLKWNGLWRVGGILLTGHSGSTRRKPVPVPPLLQQIRSLILNRHMSTLVGIELSDRQSFTIWSAITGYKPGVTFWLVSSLYVTHIFIRKCYVMKTQFLSCVFGSKSYNLGPGSSVGIATGCVLHGPGIEFR